MLSSCETSDLAPSYIHLKVEERKNLELLCEQIRGRLLLTLRLTFTNKIKHTIITTDEAPVYMNNYEYMDT